MQSAVDFVRCVLQLNTKKKLKRDKGNKNGLRRDPMIRPGWGRKACAQFVSEAMEGVGLLIRLRVPAGSWAGAQAPLHELRCSGQLSRYPAYL